jgi:hypothetical protein
VPLVALRESLLPAPVLDEVGSKVVPSDKHQIGVASLVSHEVLIASLGEMKLDHTQNSLDLVGVAVDSGGDVLLRMEL